MLGRIPSSQNCQPKRKESGEERRRSCSILLLLLRSQHDQNPDKILFHPRFGMFSASPQLQEAFQSTGGSRRLIIHKNRQTRRRNQDTGERDSTPQIWEHQSWAQRCILRSRSYPEPAVLREILAGQLSDFCGQLRAHLLIHHQMEQKTTDAWIYPEQSGGSGHLWEINNVSHEHRWSGELTSETGSR